MTDMARQDAPRVGSGRSNTVRIWDPLLRIFHWSLVAAFAIAWVTAEDVQLIHEAAGYAIAGLVVFRLIWGFVGGRYARFTQFLTGPGKTLAYFSDMAQGKERRYLGHNPAGAAMIVALLAALAGTAFTGWLMEEPDRMAMLPDLPQIVAPAWADDDHDDNKRDGEGDEAVLEELHEAFANMMLLLVALHIGGVVLASFRHNENLARAMVTGDKRAPGPDDIT